MREFGCWLAAMALLLVIFIAFGLRSHGTDDPASAAAHRAEFVAHIAAERGRPAIFKGLEFRRILWNNLRIDLLILVGTVTYGLIGSAELAANGVKMGSLYAQARMSGIPALEYLRYVVPHAIFEYGGYLIAQAAVMCYAKSAWLAMTSEERQPLRPWLLLLAPISLLLIAIGAWVEVYVTPLL